MRERVGGRRAPLLGWMAGLALVALQQGIAFQLALDEGFQLKVRQLQQLDRLLQLGRDDQPLPLPQLQTRAERQIRLLACFLLARLARSSQPKC